MSNVAVPCRRRPISFMWHMHHWLNKHAARALLAGVVFASAAAVPLAAYAEEYALVPHTKVRLTVLQWLPAKGEYQRWDALGGEFVVTGGGTIAVPLLGSMQVSGSDSAALASAIAEQLKTKAGLISAPDVTVEVVEYPPIYVAGSVASPGGYPFRPGLTVLQALALSGGRYRASLDAAGAKDPISMLGELQAVRNDILRSLGRIARLEAERAGRGEIQFPPELTGNENKRLSAEVMAQDQLIIGVRRSALDRQLKNLSELSSLFTAEIEVLGKKTEALDRRIKVVEEEAANVKSLFERGIATAGRRSELERAVAELQSNRLDQVTAIMRARQNLSESIRSALNLRDRHQVDISTDLQDAHAGLEKSKIKEEVVRKVLVLQGTSVSGEFRGTERQEQGLSFTVVRQTQGKVEEFSASESTVLRPGDVVKVAIPEQSVQQAAGESPRAGTSAQWRDAAIPASGRPTPAAR